MKNLNTGKIPTASKSKPVFLKVVLTHALLYTSVLPVSLNSPILQINFTDYPNKILALKIVLNNAATLYTVTVSFPSAYEISERIVLHHVLSNTITEHFSWLVKSKTL